jgi:hypothetical protein
MADVFRIRASSFGALYECAYRWEAIHILKMASRVGMKAHMGSAIHAGTAVFDASRLPGAGDPATPADAVEAAIEYLNTPNEDEVDVTLDDVTPREAESRTRALVAAYCRDIAPRYDFIAVEMTVRPMQIDCGDGVVIELAGTLDRTRAFRSHAGVGISDLKSGTRAVTKGEVATTKHKLQVGTYEVLYQHTTGVKPTAPASIIALPTSGSGEIKEGFIHDAAKAVVGTHEEYGALQLAADTFRTGMFRPNPNSVLCGEKYCPRWQTCIYHG